jgi:hypothetical protein
VLQELSQEVRGGGRIAHTKRQVEPSAA